METETQTPTADPGQEGLNEFDEVMDLLRAEAATDDVPEAVQGVDSKDPDATGPAGRAYKKQKDKLRQAIQIIDKQREALEAVTKPTIPAASAVSDATTQAQDEAIYQSMRTQALARLNITHESAAPKMFNYEMNRLWSEGANNLQRRKEAEGNATTVIRNTLSEIPQLTDEGRLEVAKRMKQLDPLRQVDPNVIQQEAARYIGEEAMSGRLPSGDVQPDGGELPSEESQTHVGDARPLGTVKVTGSGVRLGARTTTRRGPTPKPATPEEAAQMKSLGFHGSVEAYRAAVAKKEKYRNR